MSEVPLQGKPWFKLKSNVATSVPKMNEKCSSEVCRSSKKAVSTENLCCLSAITEPSTSWMGRESISYSDPFLRCSEEGNADFGA